MQLIAQQLGTIPYEIMTSISQRVKRIFIESSLNSTKIMLMY
ncbi:hypothetical protein [Flavobacterium sp.]